MRRFYLLVFILILSATVRGQVVLYSDTFSTDKSKWMFDADDAVGDVWDINNIYSCSETTPNNGGGYYLHIRDDLNGEDCDVADYLESSGGGLIYATMQSGANTTNQNLITIKFDWLCVGQSSILFSYGTVDYSPDGGSSWTNITTPAAKYYNQSTWTTRTITSSQVPGLLNHSDLRLRFGFTNGGIGVNPAFGVDNLSITGDVATGFTSLDAGISAAISNDCRELHLSMPALQGLSTITVYNLLGDKLFSETKKTEGQEIINIKSLSSGIYMVSLDNGSLHTMKKFIKNN